MTQTTPHTTNGAARGPVPSTPDLEWQALLADGDALVSVQATSKWAWGDLAVRVAGPSGPRGGDTTHDGRLVLYAEELQARWGDDAPSYQVLTQYRLVATAWPPQSYARNIGMPYVVLRTLVSRTDRDQKLTEFTSHCEREGITSGHYRALQAFLGQTVTPQYTLRDRPEQAERALLDMAASGSADDTEAAARVIVRALESSPAVRTETLSRLTEHPNIEQEVFEGIARQSPQTVDRAVRNAPTSVAITQAQVTQRAERQAEIDRVETSRQQRRAERTLNTPGRTNQQFVMSAAATVLRVTGDITTLRTILEQETIAYLPPEQVRTLRMELEHLRNQASACIELLPVATPA